MKTLAAALLCLFASAAVAAEPAARCPAGIAAREGDAPKAVFELGTGVSLMLCGWSGSKSDLGPYYAEFELVDARSRSVVLRFGALQSATVQARGSSLEVTEYREYPLGPNFAFTDVPHRKFSVRVESGRPLAACELVQPPKLTAEQLARLRDWYPQETRAHDDGAEKVGVLVVLAAMAGEADFETRLRDAPRDLRLDGASLEAFESARFDLDERRSGACKLRDLMHGPLP